MCKALYALYESIYKKQFDFQQLNDRIELQKAVYLLENMGIFIGDYSFSLNKYGPYSLSLDSDAACTYNSEGATAFSQNTLNGIKKIQEFLDAKNAYSQTQWIECIATVHYLSNVMRLRGQQLWDYLKEIKNYLDDETSNKKAMEIAKTVSIL